MAYNLLDNFEEQGWDFLIPLNLNQNSSGEYVDFDDMTLDEYDNSYQEYDVEKYGDYEPEVWETDTYFDDFVDDVDNDDFDNVVVRDNNVKEKDDKFIDRPNTLYDLKYSLDCDSMSDEEFLSMSAGSLLGITNAQLKFINKKSLQSAGISRYRDMLEDAKKDLPSVEQRIKFVNAISMVTFNFFQLPNSMYSAENKKKLRSYIIKIALKHELKDAIQLLSWYKDYLGMYTIACAIDKENKDAGNQYVDYPLFPKVSHIKDLHDKAARDCSTYESRRAQKHKKDTNERIKHFISSNLYKKYLYKGEVYSVFPVTSVDAILEEADSLKHCIASYIDSFAHESTYLYFIRSNRYPDRSLYTVEVLMKEGSNPLNPVMYLNQCYGYKDTIDKSDDLREFILKWCKTKKLKIECPI